MYPCGTRRDALSCFLFVNSLSFGVCGKGQVASANLCTFDNLPIKMSGTITSWTNNIPPPSSPRICYNHTRLQYAPSNSNQHGKYPMDLAEMAGIRPPPSPRPGGNRPQHPPSNSKHQGHLAMNPTVFTKVRPPPSPGGNRPQYAQPGQYLMNPAELAGIRPPPSPGGNRPQYAQAAQYLMNPAEAASIRPPPSQGIRPQYAPSNPTQPAQYFRDPAEMANVRRVPPSPSIGNRPQYAQSNSIQPGLCPTNSVIRPLPSPAPSMSPFAPSPVNPRQYSQQHAGQYGIPAAFNANHPVQGVQVTTDLGYRSTCLACPRCNTEIYTKVGYEAGMMTHVGAVVICALGCFCLACLPYCGNDFKDAAHYCPECGTCLGISKRKFCWLT